MILQIATALAVGIYVVLAKDVQHKRLVCYPSIKFQAIQLTKLMSIRQHARWMRLRLLESVRDRRVARYDAAKPTLTTGGASTPKADGCVGTPVVAIRPLATPRLIIASHSLASFIRPSRIQVHDHGAATLTIDYADRVERMRLSKSAAEQFCSRMQRVMAIEQSADPRMGLEGISVHGQFHVSGAPTFTFNFWSPDKKGQPRDFAIADAVFSLLESTTPSCELNVTRQPPV